MTSTDPAVKSSDEGGFFSLDTAREFEFRASVALNNAAVSMMERSCCRQAFETLKAAAFATKAVQAACARSADLSFDRAQDTLEITRLKLLEKLKRADRLMSRPSPMPLAIPINVFPHDATPSSIFLTSAETRQCIHHSERIAQNQKFCLNMIRIETANVDLWDEREWDLLTAIIVFNFAVSYICYSKNGGTLNNSSGNEAQMRDECIKLMFFALDLLAVQYVDCEDPFIMMRVHFITAALCQTLVHTLRHHCGILTADQPVYFRGMDLETFFRSCVETCTYLQTVHSFDILATKGTSAAAA